MCKIFQSGYMHFSKVSSWGPGQRLRIDSYPINTYFELGRKDSIPSYKINQIHPFTSFLIKLHTSAFYLYIYIYTYPSNHSKLLLRKKIFGANIQRNWRNMERWEPPIKLKENIFWNLSVVIKSAGCKSDKKP